MCKYRNFFSLKQQDCSTFSVLRFFPHYLIANRENILNFARFKGK